MRVLPQTPGSERIEHAREEKQLNERESLSHKKKVSNFMLRYTDVCHDELSIEHTQGHPQNHYKTLHPPGMSRQSKVQESRV